MSDTNKKIVKGSDISGITSHYENALVFYNESTDKVVHATEHFFITYPELEKVINKFDYELEPKKTRTWGTPMIDPIFDFVEFREFLLYNEKCTTEEMELMLEFLAEYYERKKNGEIFMEDTHM